MSALRILLSGYIRQWWVDPLGAVATHEVKMRVTGLAQWNIVIYAIVVSEIGPVFSLTRTFMVATRPRLSFAMLCIYALMLSKVRCLIANEARAAEAYL